MQEPYRRVNIYELSKEKGEQKRIHLSVPHMGGEELEFIEDAFRKNWIAPLGENVNGFERDLARFTGMKYAGAFTSGTASIHLALILLGVKPGDEVICQSFTFAATANPIRYQRAIPVFIDSETETANMDPVLLEHAIEERISKGKKPKAILLVHLYGMPAKVHKILEIAAKYDIPVIEDAAEALGSKVGDRMCGSFGKMSVFSFNGNKIITTSGGGALLANDETLIRKARHLATQARDNHPHYEHSKVGYNYRMSNILAGIGRGQMRVVGQRVSRRRQIFESYFNALGKTWFRLLDFRQNGNKTFRQKLKNFDTVKQSPTGIYFLKEPVNSVSNRWLTTIIVNPEESGGVTPNDIRLALKKEKIETRPLWKPMHLQPVYKDYPCYTNGFSEWMFEHGLCLPSGSSMTDDDLLRVINAIKSVMR
jgi:dTDP-4-amino-4,6-dideoxygalactose transaminase